MEGGPPYDHRGRALILGVLNEMEAFVSWGALYAAAVLLSAVLVLPGALAARSWGASPTVALGAGPILTLGFIGVSGVVFDLLGVGWTPVTVVSATAPVLVVLVPVVRRAAAMAEGVRGVLLGAGAAFACLLPLLLMPFVPRLQALARCSSSWLKALELIEEILLFPPVDGAPLSYAAFVLVGLFGIALAAFTRRGALVGAWGASTDSSIWARRGFLPGWIIHPLWISPDERAGLLASASDLGADDVVYGAPQTGAGLICLYTSASAYHKIASTPSASSDEGYLAQHFSQIRSDPQVCRIISDEGGNALLYTDSEVWCDDVEYFYPGYADLDLSSGFTKIASFGTAEVWRIELCR